MVIFVEVGKANQLNLGSPQSVTDSAQEGINRDTNNSKGALLGAPKLLIESSLTSSKLGKVKGILANGCAEEERHGSTNIQMLWLMFLLWSLLDYLFMEAGSFKVANQIVTNYLVV